MYICIYIYHFPFLSSTYFIHLINIYILPINSFIHRINTYILLIRQMCVFDSAEYIKELYNIPAIAQALRHPIKRTPGDGGVWDDELLRLWTDEMKLKILWENSATLPSFHVPSYH